MRRFQQLDTGDQWAVFAVVRRLGWDNASSRSKSELVAFEFNKTALEAPAGKVTTEMTNPSSVPHDIAIEGNGVDVAGNIVMDGGTSTVTATLKPGTYTFLCTVDSHAEDGMEGTLTVR